MIYSNESEEMYLKTIYILSKTNDYVRLVDVAGRLGYAKSSVSNALKDLQSRGLIVYGDDKKIILTEDGLKEASIVNEKYDILTKYFESLGVSKEIAEIDACKIEHIISNDVLEAMKSRLN